MDIRTTATRPLVLTGLATAALVLGVAGSGSATLAPGTPAKDVTVGTDTDNADNPFIQPPGVTAKQHMDDTDVLFGRGNDDLLVGKLGGDTLLGGAGSDILVGGPEKGQGPNSDVLVGDGGNDVNLWAPGDGSDAFVGNDGTDTMVFAPFVEGADGSLLTTRAHGRRVPHVTTDAQPAFGCTIVPVPATQHLGAQYLVRFTVNGAPVVTVRQKDVERVICPSPYAGKVRVAWLTATHPTFRTVSAHRIHGVVGDILAPVR